MATATDRSPRDRPGETDQHTRLLDAIVEVVAQDGYPHARVGAVAEHAGISRVGFYERFASKEECFFAAHERHAERIARAIEDAVVRGEPHMAAHITFAELARLADREPATFTFLTHEVMLAAPRGWEERDRLMLRLEQIIERRWAHAPTGEPLLDAPVALLLEGVIRLLGLRIRRQAGITDELRLELFRWVDSYSPSPGPARWRELVPEPTLVRSAGERASEPALPRPVPKGKGRVSTDVLRGVQREGIMYATAEAIRAAGLTEVTVGDIAARAGVSRDVFYAHFRDKEQAFEETFKMIFERLLASMGGAFFTCGGDWREQVWEAGIAFANFLEDNSTLAHFIFVGTNASLPFIERIDDFVQAFTIFIDGGYRWRPEAEAAPRILSDALVCTVLQAVTLHVRHDRVGELRGLVPAIAYTVIAPFTGPAEATAFVSAKVHAAGSGAGVFEPALEPAR